MPVDRPAVRQPEGHRRRQRDRGHGLLRPGRRHDDDPRAAVVHDVRDLARLQVVVDRGEVEPAAHRGPVDLQVVQPVLGEQREPFAGAQAVLVQDPDQPDRALLELGVAQ